ncbi:hypothetical protein [Parachlamydia acanthamoebae]|uniref:hypothetical protein n=1 Tax=Parachlamydia acanthamoebae TaxID=83552 RepID=UPI000751474C|nr:hypothetical protein [Parachlamydia acanthamoebae]
MGINEENKLLKILQEQFKNAFNYTEDDYLHAFGKASQVLLASIIFFPDFVEIDSRIFLKRNVLDQDVIRKMLEDGEDITEVEKKFNFIEVDFLFDGGGRDLAEDADIVFAQIIKTAWDAWLKYQYPSRKFIVEIIDVEGTGESLGVQFCEESKFSIYD